MLYLEGIWKMLKKNWKSLLISCIVFLITFSHSNAFIESQIWVKWAIIFVFCPLIGVLHFSKRKNEIQIDVFYLVVSSFSALLLIKAIIEDSFVYYSCYIICFWILYSFFYFNNLSKYFLYNAFAFIVLALSVSGFIQYLAGYNL